LLLTSVPAEAKPVRKVQVFSQARITAIEMIQTVADPNDLVFPPRQDESEKTKVRDFYENFRNDLTEDIRNSYRGPLDSDHLLR